MLRTAKNTHWYTRNGEPFYEIENKSKPGEMRSPTVRDARKLGLVPSVTGICDMVAKHGLQDWKYDQYINAAVQVTEERREAGAAVTDTEGKILKSVYDIIVERGQFIAAAAANLGGRVHDGILDCWLKDQTIPQDLEIESYIMTYIKWHGENVGLFHFAERPFAVANKYGGRVDMAFSSTGDGLVIADLKTRKTKEGKKIPTYITDGYQLEAYCKGVYPHKRKIKLWNIIISTTEPGRIEVVDWTPRRSELWRGFKACYELWVQEHNYDPRTWKPKEEKKAGDLDMCTGCGSHLAESGGKCQPCLDYQEHQSIR